MYLHIIHQRDSRTDSESSTHVFVGYELNS